MDGEECTQFCSAIQFFCVKETFVPTAYRLRGLRSKSEQRNYSHQSAMLGNCGRHRKHARWDICARLHHTAHIVQQRKQIRQERTHARQNWRCRHRWCGAQWLREPSNNIGTWITVSPGSRPLVFPRSLYERNLCRDNHPCRISFDPDDEVWTPGGSYFVVSGLAEQGATREKTPTRSAEIRRKGKPTAASLSESGPLDVRMDRWCGAKVFEMSSSASAGGCFLDDSDFKLRSALGIYSFYFFVSGAGAKQESGVVARFGSSCVFYWSCKIVWYFLLKATSWSTRHVCFSWSPALWFSRIVRRCQWGHQCRIYFFQFSPGNLQNGGRSNKSQRRSYGFPAPRGLFQICAFDLRALRSELVGLHHPKTVVREACS